MLTVLILGCCRLCLQSISVPSSLEADDCSVIRRHLPTLSLTNWGDSSWDQESAYLLRGTHILKTYQFATGRREGV